MYIKKNGLRIGTDSRAAGLYFLSIDLTLRKRDVAARTFPAWLVEKARVEKQTSPLSTLPPSHSLYPSFSHHQD